MSTKVSIYEGVTNTKGNESLLPDIMRDIQSGKWKKQIEWLRNIKSEADRKKFKNSLPCFTGAGLFRERNEKGLLEHSGRIIIDFDKLQNVEETRQTLINDPHTEYLFSSCSDTGLAAVVKIDGNRHRESFEFLEKYYKEKYALRIDPACKDVSRLRFISYDPDLYCNVGAETVIVPPEFTKETKFGHTAPVSYANGKNHEIVKAIINSGKLLSSDDSYDTWVRIGFALANEFGEGGRPYFHELSRISPKYDPADCDRKFDNCLKTNRGDVTFATIVQMAKDASVSLETTEEVERRKVKKTKNKKDNDEPVLSAYFEGLVDIVTDNGGWVAYLVNAENSLEVATVREIDKVLYAPPDQRHLPFALADADNVLKWYKSDNDQILFKDVLTYLKRFSYLPDRQWLIVACNVFLSYLQDHPDIHYLPMLLFYAVPERGKSRTGKAVSYISFRGVHIVDLREANLFRFSQNLKATLFFDLMDLWKKAEKNGAEDILLLRYEKGARATRVIYPEKGAFKDTVYYDIFGSTLIATNEAVHKILGSRCIDISMPNKPGDYENPTPEKARELKERLTAWRARVMKKPLPGVETIPGLNGRLWDISKPLLQVCKMVYPQGFDELTNALWEVAGHRIEDKKESIEGRIVSALCELSPPVVPVWEIKTTTLLEALNKERPDAHKLTPQYVGKKLKAMGVHTRHIHGLSQTLLSRSDFNLLLEQYGICENIRPLSTNSTCPTESRDSAGRELVESGEHSTNIRPAGTLVNSGQVELVELGRECGRVGNVFEIKEEMEVLG